MASKLLENRLSRNFHKTFKPERIYVNAMLKFAAGGGSGDAQAISAATGIPTGVSSGKVIPTFDYCIGMGLLVDKASRSATKKPELTPFGRTVYLEDPFLKCPVSQWIAHFNLCGPLNGADVWYQTFFEGFNTLGMKFNRSTLETHLSVIYSTKQGGLIGPLIGMYEDDASFKLCAAITETDGKLARREAPLKDEMIRGYGAWLLQQIQAFFPGQAQVSVAELDAKAGCRAIPGWSGVSFINVLSQLEKKAIFEVDRHMDPWLIRPKLSTEDAWKNIFADMI